MNPTPKEHVETLLKKAAEAAQPHEAMNLAQAALNAAHAIQVLKLIESK